MKIYLIPGLGYDCRIYEKLNFGDLNVERIEWITPKRNESILDYSKRLFADIEENEEEIVLIGHSFGGVVAQEIATVKKIDKIILLSSIQSEKERPFGFTLLNWFRIYKLFTKEISLKTVKYWGSSHGLETTKLQELFKSMVGKQSNEYLQWALKTLGEWKKKELPARTKLLQIHGGKDLTFPIKLIKHPDKIIKTGGHIMVYKQPEIVSEILRQELKTTF